MAEVESGSERGLRQALPLAELELDVFDRVMGLPGAGGERRFSQSRDRGGPLASRHHQPALG